MEREASAAGSAAGAGEPPVDDEADGDFVEIYVNVGRRDGARATDYQQALTDRAGIDRGHVRRIRVRERNAFVSVRREDLARALTALQGATLAGKVAMAEQARERGAGDGDAVTLMPGPIGGPNGATDTLAPAFTIGASPPTPGPGLIAAASSGASDDDPTPTGRSGG